MFKNRKLMLATMFALWLLLDVAAPALAAGGGVGGGGRFGGGGGGGGGPVGFPGGGGGGFGLPMFFPFLGFGGGSIIPILFFLFLMWLMRQGQNRGSGGATYAQPSDANIIRLEVALLATARDVPPALHRLVASVNTSTERGLSELLQQATLLLLRNQEYWHAASYQYKRVPYRAAESEFNSLTLAARSKLSFETITNVNGVQQTDTKRLQAPADAIAPGDYFVVALIVASSAPLHLRPIQTAEQLREQLAEIGSAAGSNLEGVQVIWQPDVTGESLSRDDVIAMYPELAPV